MRGWLADQGWKSFPIVAWAERGGYGADGPGNSVPRFHVTWGTGPRIVEIIETRVRAGLDRGLVTFAFRHQVDELVVTGGAVTGVRGTVLEPSAAARGVASSRKPVGDFEFGAPAVIVTSGGIGHNRELIRRNWPAHAGRVPERMLAGVPAHVDGRMLEISERAGASVINRDRMWHYTEGITNYDPVWPDHGIRIAPGPSSLWLDATGTRLPPPLFPGFDTLGTMRYINRTGFDHTWLVLDQRIIEKEFALSGQEQNPDLTGRSIRLLLERVKKGAPGPVEAFKRKGVAPAARSQGGPADRRPAAPAHPEDVGRLGDRPVRAGGATGRHDGRRPVRGRGGRGIRWRRGARVSRAGGHVPGRVPVLRAGRGPGRGRAAVRAGAGRRNCLASQYPVSSDDLREWRTDVHLDARRVSAYFGLRALR